MNDAAREAQKGVQYPAPTPLRKPSAAPAAGLDAAIAKTPNKSASTAAGLSAIAPKESEDIAALRKVMGESAAVPEQSFKAFDEEQRKRKESLEGKREDNFNMALVRAGLGMMTSNSPYALQGIGEGATKGVTAFLEGKKTIADFDKEIAKAEIDKEQAINAHNMKKYDAAEKRRETAIKGYNVIIDAQTKGQEIAAMDRRTQAQILSGERTASKQLDLMNKQALMTLSSNLTKEMKELQKVAGDVTNPGRKAAAEELGVLKQQLDEVNRSLAGKGGVELPTAKPKPLGAQAGWGIREIK
jgi:hypothetical protein